MVKYGPVQTFAPNVITTAFRCASIRSVTAAMDEPQQQQQQQQQSPPADDDDERPPYSSTETSPEQQQHNYHEQQASQQAPATVRPQQQENSCNQQPPIVVTASPTSTQTVVVVVTNPAASSGSASPAEAAATTTVTISVSTAPPSSVSSCASASSAHSVSYTTDSDMTNYNLDHLYCHPNEKGSPKVTVSTTPPPPLTPPQSALAATMQLQQQHQQQQQQQPVQHHQRADAIHVDTGPDMSAVLREIKHLKEMLMMHLDLIQEQNDQLTTRDKQMLALRNENDVLRARLAKLVAAKPMQCDEASDEPEPHKPPMTVATKSLSQLPVPPPPMVAIPVTCASDHSLPVSVPCIKTESGSVPVSANIDIVQNEPSSFGVNNLSMNVIHRCKTQLDSLTQIMTGSSGLQHRVIPTPLPSHSAAIQPRAAAIVEAAVAATNAGHSGSMSLMQSKATASAPIVAAFEPRNTSSFAVVDRVLPPFASVQIGALGNAEDSQCSLLGPMAPDEELTATHDATAVLDTDQTQSPDKPARSQNSRRRRKRHDSIGMSRKRRRTHLQSMASKSPVPTNECMPVVDMATAAAIEQPSAMLPQLTPDTAAIETRRSFITTSHCYTTRQWFIDEVATEVDQQLAEFSVDEHAAAASAAAAAAAAAASSSVTGQPHPTAVAHDTPHLELPCWKLKPVIPTSDASETEDFSAAVFQRRHARFELDERKRKKWDIQRIREQRNVERLRRRQNRDDLPEQPKGTEELGTFYPAADQVLWVQMTDELPVLAFGEPVPVLPNIEFGLPWHRPLVTSAPTPTPMLPGDAPEILHHLHNFPPMPSPVQLRSTNDGGHTAIVYTKKKTARRQHNLLIGAPATMPFLSTGGPTGPGTSATVAAPSTSNAVPAARTNGGAGSGIGSGAKSGAKLGRGHSGLHSKRSSGGRKNKR